jgi:hypothetical protein
LPTYNWVTLLLLRTPSAELGHYWTKHNHRTHALTPSPLTYSCGKCITYINLHFILSSNCFVSSIYILPRSKMNIDKNITLCNNVCMYVHKNHTE